MRNKTTEPEDNNAEVVSRLLADRLMGVELNSPGAALDRAAMFIRHTINATIAGINSGVCGEPTPADRQRLHELRSLLEDLP